LHTNYLIYVLSVFENLSHVDLFSSQEKFVYFIRENAKINGKRYDDSDPLYGTCPLYTLMLSG